MRRTDVQGGDRVCTKDGEDGFTMRRIAALLWVWLDRVMYLILVKVLKIRWFSANWDSFMQFVKFGIVGASNTLIHYVTYLLCLALGCHYLAASVIGFCISVTNAYYWNNKYVFQEEEGAHRTWWQTYLKTFLSYAATGLILENILLVVWIRLLHIHEAFAPVVTLLITIPLNFIMNKYWAYKDKK